MKKVFFFVHIPKTAGTSFRVALQQNDNVHMLYDYGARSPESSRELLEMDSRELTTDSSVFDVHKSNVLCGHVGYQRYAHCVDEENVISIIRNPMERIVSEYQHAKRHGGLTCSFEEFSTNALQRNKQWRLLDGLKAEGSALVGLTSHYKYFVELFSDRYALHMDEISINNAPVSDAKDRLNISPAAINKAYKLNRKDMVSFLRLARLFAEFVKKAGYNTVPDRGTGWNCRIDSNNQVIGWFSRSQKDCFFVVIGVNGKKRAIVSLDQCRKDISNKGLSNDPVCGFSYPLALLGAERGDVVSVGILGSRKFKKELSVE